MADEGTEGESGESQASTEGQAAADTGAQQQQAEESFIDPKDLPEELKPHWKRMHSAFSQKMAAIKQDKEKVTAYDRFMSDAEYAKQTILANAAKLGLTVTEAQAASQYLASANGNAAAKPTDLPPELVEAVREKLDPSMHWAAEQLAAGSWALLKPVLQMFREEKQSKQESEHNRLAEELSEKIPGWEVEEDNMKQIENFLANPNQLRHPVFGNKKEFLYKIATGGARATQEAINRMSEAARNRSSIGSAGRISLPDISDRIRNAKTDQEAFEIAAEDAVKRSGAA